MYPLTNRSPLGMSFVLLITLAALGQSARAVDVVLSPAEARLKADVGYLADDLRDGRAPGTNGIEASADYIASVFRELGLKTAPGAKGYFQPFGISGTPTLGEKASYSIKLKGVDQPKSLTIRTEFAPLSLGGSADLNDVPLVFVGYGITAKEPAKKLDYDDYAGLDVKGKAVLIIRHEPQQNDEKSPFDGKDISQYAGILEKTTNAFQHGAKAILIVSDGQTAKNEDKMLTLNYASRDGQSSAIPLTMITRAFADSILKSAGAPPLAEVEKKIDETLKPQSKVLEGVTVSGQYTINRNEIKTKNVIGVLEGTGPLADETIVVGGHYDHLGHGGFNSGSLAFLSKDIHNGADDNASGTAMVLEMARRLAKRPEPLPRRVVFMAFSGEEKGLLGSMHYVRNPLYPLDKTVFMINFDMVGRLNEKSELTMFGVGTTPGAGELVDSLGSSLGFTIKKVRGMSDGIGGSDHQSFAVKNIPVLFAFTGLHRDYHKPTDDHDLINFNGMARIADLGELLLLNLTKRPTRPEFTKAGSQTASKPATPAPAETKTAAKPAENNPHAAMPPEKDKTKAGDDTARVSITAYFGSIPDYDDSTTGVKLSGTSEGSPAEKAGLKGGDVIIGFAGKPIGTIYDYTNSLAKQKPGDTVDVKIKRDGKELTLKVKLVPRPGR